MKRTRSSCEFSLKCSSRFFLPPYPQDSTQEHETYAANESHSDFGWLKVCYFGIVLRHPFLVLMQSELDDLGQVQGAAVRGLGDLFATAEAIGDD